MTLYDLALSADKRTVKSIGRAVSNKSADDRLGPSLMRLYGHTHGNTVQQSATSYILCSMLSGHAWLKEQVALAPFPGRTS